MALWNKKLYPLVAILAGLFIIVFGLVMARELLACSVFLAAVFVWLLLLICTPKVGQTFGGAYFHVKRKEV